MTTKERYEKFVEYFSKEMPDPSTELNYGSPFQLLVAVILSAQCTDKRVNVITVDLFKRYPTVKEMAESDSYEIFEYIKSCSYPNNKAKHLAGMSKMLVSDYNSEIPSDIKELQKLPGVGRKTANVVGAVVFDLDLMPVDTHVFRVSARIGLTKNAKTPLETEKQLVKHLPKNSLNKAHHWIILHGRYVCTARKPKCEKCGIKEICKYFEKID